MRFDGRDPTPKLGNWLDGPAYKPYKLQPQVKKFIHVTYAACVDGVKLSRFPKPVYRKDVLANLERIVVMRNHADKDFSVSITTPVGLSSWFAYARVEIKSLFFQFQLPNIPPNEFHCTFILHGQI